MSVDEPDDEIIRKKEFKRSFELNIEGLDSREDKEVEVNKNENDDALGEVFDLFGESNNEVPGKINPDGSVYLEPDRDLISELSIEGEKKVNWSLMVSMIFVYSAISILVGINFEALPGTISLIFLAALGFGLGEIWVPKERMELLGVTWIIISMKVLYGLALELRQWGIIDSDPALGLVLLSLVGVNISVSYRYNHDAIAAQATLVLLAIGSTAGSVLDELGVAAMIFLATVLLHGLAINRKSGNLASLGIAASNIWIGMHAITSGFEIGQLRVLPLDSPLLLFLLLMMITILNATMATRFARDENWFSSAFISLGLAKPGLWGVSISLGMIGALMAVAANREDLGYALGMVTFLGGAFGGSYLVVRGVNWKRVSRPLISGAILLTIFLLVVETDSNYYGLSVYEIFTILGFILTSLVLLRDQNSVSDRVLWVGSVTILILLVLLVPSEFSENGGDGGILLLFLLSILHIGTAIMAIKRDSPSLSGITVLLPWSWILIEEILQQTVDTIYVANNFDRLVSIVNLDSGPLLIYLIISSLLLFTVNLKAGETGINLASKFMGITEISSSIRDSNVLQLWNLGLWLPLLTIIVLAQFGGFTAITILIITMVISGLHVTAKILDIHSGETSQILIILALFLTIINWKYGLDEIVFAILFVCLIPLLLKERDENIFTLGMSIMSIPPLISISGREVNSQLLDYDLIPTIGMDVVAIFCSSSIILVFLKRAETMEKILKPTLGCLTLLIATIIISFQGDKEIIQALSILLFIISSIWLISRGEIRAEIKVISKRNAIISSINTGKVVMSENYLDNNLGKVNSFNPKLAELNELRKKKREKSDTDDLAELMITDVNHQPLVGTVLLILVIFVTALFGIFNGANQDIWPLILILSGSFSSLIVLLVRNRTKGLELELPHFLGIEMPVAIAIIGLIISILSAHVLSPGSSNRELLDLVIVVVFLVLLSTVSIMNHKNILERISIACDWIIFPLLTIRVAGALVGEALPMPFTVDPTEGEILNWIFPLIFIEVILILCILVNFWVNEKKLKTDESSIDKRMIISRTLAIVVISFGVAGILAAILSVINSLRYHKPEIAGFGIPSFIFGIIGLSYWLEGLSYFVADLIFITGIILIICCSLTIPFRKQEWSFTLAIDAHLLIVSGLFALGLMGKIIVPLAFIVMSSTVWIIGILQLRRNFRIWGLMDLIIGIIITVIFTSQEISNSFNLLLVLCAIALQLGVISWLSSSNQEELIAD